MNVAESSKKRRAVTREESSEDDGEGNPPLSGGVGHRQSYAPNLNVGVTGVGEVDSDDGNNSYHSKELRSPISSEDENGGGQRPLYPQFDDVQNNRLKRSYPECICSRCGHPNHNSRNCMNYGCHQSQGARNQWRQVKCLLVKVMELQPLSTPQQQQKISMKLKLRLIYPNLNQQGLPPTPSQPLVSAAPTQTTRLAPMGQGRPNTPYRQLGLIATTAARPTYRGPFLGASSSSSPTTVSPTSAAGPFLGASSSSRPSTISPTFVAGPFQGASASSPINFRTRGTTLTSSAVGPFQGASASTYNRFMQFMPTPGFHPPPPKNP
ncbi:hypothetical protein SESBI_24079 [Sesbania bispinosa]|nr:hypothetical protein SESBI_24079 [Sesbania bispinosa]